MSYRTGKYTVCRRVRAPFSPEIVQAAAVKGLSVKRVQKQRSKLVRKQKKCKSINQYQSIFYFMSVHIEVIIDKNKNI